MIYYDETRFEVNLFISYVTRFNGYDEIVCGEYWLFFTTILIVIFLKETCPSKT